MLDRIQSLISENNSLIAEAYSKLAEMMVDDGSDTELKDIAALLKINEIVLMELKEKQSFNNEETVLNSLSKMKKALISTNLELGN
jgi:hypothetical protein